MKISNERRQHYFKLMEKQDKGSLSAASFCSKHQMNISVFNYWRIKYKKEQNTLSQIPKNKPQPKNTTFHPITLSERPLPYPEDKIEIFYPSGIRMSLPSSYDLRPLLEALNHGDS